MTTNESLHEMLGEWTGSFTLDGMEYKCNEVSNAPVNRMGGLMMDLGGQDSVTSDGNDCRIVIPANRKSATIAFLIHTINKYVKPDKKEPVTVGIYRTGEPEPIFYKQYDCFKDDITDVITDHDVQPGEYIMAMGNIVPYEHLREPFEVAGNFYVFRFLVLEHGENTSHPTLLGAEIDNDLSVNLIFFYDKDVSQEHFSCECFDSNFRLVAKADTMKCNDIFSNNICAQLKKELWWTDGDYQLIVYHNCEPYAHVRFITQDGESNVVWSDTLSRDSVFYKLCKDVKDSGKKNMFCSLNGCGELKKKVLGYLCVEHPYVNEHLMLAANGIPEYDVMNTVAGIFHPRYAYRAASVNELLKGVSGEKNERETLDVMLARRSTIIYGLDDLTTPANEWFARLLLKVAADRHGFIILYGTVHELQRVLDMYPDWTDYMMAPSWWNVYSYTQMDGLRTVEHILKSKRLEALPSTREKIAEVIEDNWPTVQSWGRKDYEEWVNSEILMNIKRRLFSDNSFSDVYLKNVLEEDVTMTVRYKHPGEGFVSCLAKLERMVGLTEIKEHLKLLLKRIDFDRKRESLGLRKLQTGQPHMVFTGNPGTGKTTVAKLLGHALKQMGYLTKGEVVAVERAQMVGRHIGSTEARMTELLKKAKGNVLFIDEAYSLCDNNEGDRKDFGCRALECLLPVLSDSDSDIIVILAGYEKEMNEMMGLNPGMKGRFPYWFKFEDYSTDELHEIAIRLLEENDYKMTDNASKKLKACIGEVMTTKDRLFHNARWIHQLVQDGVLAMMAERLYDTEADENKVNLFRTITVEDIVKGYERMRTDKKGKPLRKVGFR